LANNEVVVGCFEGFFQFRNNSKVSEIKIGSLVRYRGEDRVGIGRFADRDANRKQLFWCLTFDGSSRFLVRKSLAFGDSDDSLQSTKTTAAAAATAFKVQR